MHKKKIQNFKTAEILAKKSKLIEKGRRAKSLELFKQKKVSLGLGAKLAGLTVSEYLDLLEENKIPLNLSKREAQKALSTARKVL